MSGEGSASPRKRQRVASPESKESKESKDSKQSKESKQSKKNKQNKQSRLTGWLGIAPPKNDLGRLATPLRSLICSFLDPASHGRLAQCSLADQAICKSLASYPPVLELPRDLIYEPEVFAVKKLVTLLLGQSVARKGFSADLCSYGFSHLSRLVDGILPVTSVTSGGGTRTPSDVSWSILVRCQVRSLSLNLGYDGSIDFQRLSEVCPGIESFEIRHIDKKCKLGNALAGLVRFQQLRVLSLGYGDGKIASCSSNTDFSPLMVLPNLSAVDLGVILDKHGAKPLPAGFPLRHFLVLVYANDVPPGDNVSFLNSRASGTTKIIMKIVDAPFLQHLAKQKTDLKCSILELSYEQPPAGLLRRLPFLEDLSCRPGPQLLEFHPSAKLQRLTTNGSICRRQWLEKLPSTVTSLIFNDGVKLETDLDRLPSLTQLHCLNRSIVDVRRFEKTRLRAFASDALSTVVAVHHLPATLESLEIHSRHVSDLPPLPNLTKLMLFGSFFDDHHADLEILSRMPLTRLHLRGCVCLHHFNTCFEKHSFLQLTLQPMIHGDCMDCADEPDFQETSDASDDGVDRTCILARQGVDIARLTLLPTSTTTDDSATESDEGS